MGDCCGPSTHRAVVSGAIFVSHGHRMKKLLGKLMNYKGEHKGIKEDFQNGAIVRLDISTNGAGKRYVSQCILIYPGSHGANPVPGKPKQMYFEVGFGRELLRDAEEFGPVVDLKVHANQHGPLHASTQTFFVTRHGHASHSSHSFEFMQFLGEFGVPGSTRNIKRTRAAMGESQTVINGTNTHLTDKGMIEAYQSGVFLRWYCERVWKHGDLKPDIYVSDLIRTTETGLMVWAGYKGVALGTYPVTITSTDDELLTMPSVDMVSKSAEVIDTRTNPVPFDTEPLSPDTILISLLNDKVKKPISCIVIPCSHEVGDGRPAENISDMFDLSDVAARAADNVKGRYNGAVYYLDKLREGITERFFTRTSSSPEAYELRPIYCDLVPTSTDQLPFFQPGRIQSIYNWKKYATHIRESLPMGFNEGGVAAEWERALLAKNTLLVVKLDWSIYKEYFKGGYRKEGECNKSPIYMIESADSHILRSQGGGGYKRRRKYKGKTKRKSTRIPKRKQFKSRKRRTKRIKTKNKKKKTKRR